MKKLAIAAMFVLVGLTVIYAADSVKRTIVYLVLDESGSMNDDGKKEKAITAVNAYIDGIKEADKHTEFWFTTFNMCRITNRAREATVGDAEKLSSENYIPDCGTPLYDAVGHAIESLSADMDARKGGAGYKVLFVILTDGLENQSHEFTTEKLNALISSKKESGWKFVYLGTDHDGWAQSQAMGIQKSDVLIFPSGNLIKAVNQISVQTSEFITNVEVSTKSFFTPAQQEQIQKP